MTLPIHITETELLVDNQLVGPRPEHTSRTGWAELADYINAISDEDDILDRRIIKLTEERDEALNQASEFQDESAGYKRDYDECQDQLNSIRTIMDEGNA